MNTNDYVWIRLTDVGRRMLRENYDRLFFGFPDLVKAHPFTLPTEVNGWTRMQLWHVANEFGRGMYNGADVPFETEFSLTDPASALETPVDGTVDGDGQWVRGKWHPYHKSKIEGK